MGNPPGWTCIPPSPAVSFLPMAGQTIESFLDEAGSDLRLVSLAQVVTSFKEVASGCGSRSTTAVRSTPTSGKCTQGSLFGCSAQAIVDHRGNEHIDPRQGIVTYLDLDPSDPEESKPETADTSKNSSNSSPPRENSANSPLDQSN